MSGTLHLSCTHKTEKCFVMAHADTVSQHVPLGEAQAQVNKDIHCFPTEELAWNNDDHQRIYYKNVLTIYVLIAQSTDPAPAEQLVRIPLDQHQRCQHADPFGTVTCARLNRWESSPFRLEKQGRLV